MIFLTSKGTNPDPAQWFNFAGVIHWNDWKPITGENVWAAILAPMQVLLVKNCSHIEKFKDFASAPNEVQLALSIMPASEAMLSPMGTFVVSVLFCLKCLRCSQFVDDVRVDVSLP
jgi:hypothetical protein